jgi:hypothetical protein
MTTDATAAGPWRTSPARAAMSWIALWLSCGLLGWRWLVSPDGSAWKAVSLVAIWALAALAGGAWYLSRVHAEGRRRAALDRYAERELAKGSAVYREGVARRDEF